MKCFLKILAQISGDARPESHGLRSGALIVLAGALLGGCAVVPANQSLLTDGQAGEMREVMARKDRIVHLSRPEADDHKPVLLLLHGATDDPTEMMAIVQAWRGKYDVFLYSYNYHERVQAVAAKLVGELKCLKAKKPFAGGLTVVTFSYSAIVFRTAVVRADDPALFAGVSLVQLVPTAGGSFLARSLRNPLVVFLVSLTSQPSTAERPYGRFAEEIWGGAGSKKFYAAIPPERMHTILIEADEHSLAGVKNLQIQAHYHNGLGPNVVVIPKSFGVTHDYFPTNPVGRAYLRKVLETLPATADNGPATTPASAPGIFARTRLIPGAENSGAGVVQ